MTNYCTIMTKYISFPNTLCTVVICLFVNVDGNWTGNIVSNCFTTFVIFNKRQTMAFILNFRAFLIFLFVRWTRNLKCFLSLSFQTKTMWITKYNYDSTWSRRRWGEWPFVGKPPVFVKVSLLSPLPHYSAWVVFRWVKKPRQFVIL